MVAGRGFTTPAGSSRHALDLLVLGVRGRRALVSDLLVEQVGFGANDVGPDHHGVQAVLCCPLFAGRDQGAAEAGPAGRRVDDQVGDLDVLILVQCQPAVETRCSRRCGRGRAGPRPGSAG